MVPDQERTLGSQARRAVQRFRKRVAPLLVGLFCCVIIAGPALSPGAAGVDQRYPDDGPPTDCIDGPDPEYAGSSGGYASGNATPERDRSGEEPSEDLASGTDPPGDAAAGTDPSGVVGVVDPVESGYRVDFRVPGNRTRPFAVGNVPGGEVVATHGFYRDAPGWYAWNTSVEDPWVRVRVSGTGVGGHRFRFPGDDETLVGTVIRHDPDVSFRPADRGAIGAQFMVLDGVTRYERRVGCQRLTLVVPDAVSEERLGSPERALGVVSEAARRLDVGHAYREVRIYVMPGEPDDVLAGQARDNEFVVYAGADPGATWNAWIHEYVHTRQGDVDGEGFRWFREASASYLSVRLALEGGLASPREYDRILAEGARPAPRPLVGSPDTSSSRRRGAAVLSRLESVLADHDRTVGDLLAWVNARERRSDSSPDQRRVERRVENWTGSRAAADLFRADVVFTQGVDPEYVSGPWWLPPRVRRFLPAFGHPVARAGAGVVLVVSLLAYLRDVRRASRWA